MNEAQQLRIGQIIQELNDLSHSSPFPHKKEVELQLQALSLRLRAEELIT